MAPANKVNADLQREREKCTFNTTELTNLIDGGADKTEERKKRGNGFVLISKLMTQLFE